jgi:polyisoprenoid-binding protein YceI
MRRIIPILALILFSGNVFAQKKTTTSATISFDATTPKDKLPQASNKTVIGSINTATGEVAFEAAVKNFSFGNPRMQEHFNGSNWFNSDTYPVFAFTGKINKLNNVKFNKNGTYKVTVTGDLKVRDVTKKQTFSGTITVKDGKISVKSDFVVKLSDYNITGQPIDAGKVSKEPKVKLAADFQ